VKKVTMEPMGERREGNYTVYPGTLNPSEIWTAKNLKDIKKRFPLSSEKEVKVHEAR